MNTIKKKTFYLIGSLRNPHIPHLGNLIRQKTDIEVFDDWFSAGKIADDSWQEYSNLRGQTYKEALNGYASRHVFAFDKYHLDRCDGAILVLPAGKSAHIELGYMSGKEKPTYVYFDQVPERYDVMYQFATDVVFSDDELIEKLNA